MNGLGMSYKSSWEKLSEISSLQLERGRDEGDLIQWGEHSESLLLRFEPAELKRLKSCKNIAT